MARTIDQPTAAIRLNTARAELIADHDDYPRNADEQPVRIGDGEEGLRRERSQVVASGVDAFAPVLEAWKQVFRSWTELTDTMVKAQQQTFASMIGAATTTPSSTLDRIGQDQR